ncbi:viroplasmin family protein [Mammaliicoccus sp. A-M2]|uniref:ribonuclease H1 domain-containing protein n=1 Tax=Mammaliicoccus sp. A-M2 TaxID=2898662 RepID=UPI001EFBABF6|nr:viroplasmin family protein [Mammaliicoccus sp. A-M2]
MSFYAVKVGKEVGIFRNWNEVNPLVSGYKGAIYKKFDTEAEAEAFLNTENYSEEATAEAFEIEDLKCKLKDNQAIIITDGSYDKVNERYGYGIVLLSNDGSDEFFDSGNERSYIESRNVAGEVMGVLEGVKICNDKSYKEVFLYYDYEGLEKWATKEWKTKKAISKYYVEQLEKYKDIKINFIKVKSHTGHHYNDRADELAKYSLMKKGNKTYTDGTVYISGVMKEELSNIIYDLEKDYKSNEEYFNFSDEEKDFKVRYVVESSTSKVVITYYKKNKSLYIQGKQSKLFSEIIDKLILNTPNIDVLNERLNEVYTKRIEEDEILVKMSEIIPNYRSNEFQNIDKIIYSAVYNLELDLIKKDYSDLAQPSFRVLEYILHRIINDMLNVETDNDGQNKFNYFSKDEVTKVYYYNKDTALLSQSCKVLLNDVYNFYVNNRHQYSHTSYNDEDISTIEDIEIAKDIIKEALSYFDKYCIEANNIN